MTGKQIKTYKKRLAVIVKQCNEIRLSNDEDKQKQKKLDSMVGNFSELAIDVCAPIQFGKEIIELREILNKAYEKKSMEEKLKVIEAIIKLYYQNILFALQTEMMFNACVSSKWSCFFAAVATISACISIILTLL